MKPFQTMSIINKLHYHSKVSGH